MKQEGILRPKVLNLFTLMVINIAIFGTINNWSVIAGKGLSTFVFFLLAIIVFYIPLLLVTAELTSSFHQPGGIYLWVKEAFGHRAGFISVWLIFIQNASWVPLPLMWVGYSLAFAMNVEWITTPFYHLISGLIIIWATAFLAFKGATFLKYLSTFGILFGAFIPTVGLVILSLVWYFRGEPVNISLSVEQLKTDLFSLSGWVLFPGLFFSLFGAEISAFHSRDVKDAKHTYPKAIFLSSAIYIIMIILSSTAIAVMFPAEKISFFDTTTKELAHVFHLFHISWLYHPFLLLVGLGIYVTFANWFCGPIRGLLKVAKQGDLPPVFRQTNEHNMPSTLIITQALINSIIAILFVLFPDVTTAYWFILSLTTIWYFISYLILFAAAIKLRYKHPTIERPFKIPGKAFGLWSVCGLGFVSCLVGLGFGFILPQQVLQLSTLNYFLMIVLGVIVTCLVPWFILLFKRPGWTTPPEEEI